MSRGLRLRVAFLATALALLPASADADDAREVKPITTDKSDSRDARIGPIDGQQWPVESASQKPIGAPHVAFGQRLSIALEEQAEVRFGVQAAEREEAGEEVADAPGCRLGTTVPAGPPDRHRLPATEADRDDGTPPPIAPGGTRCV